MQREIKFRFWDAFNKKILKDFSYNLESIKRSIIKGVFYLEIINNYEGQDFLPLQFTGLLDKNGKEIYEGDIIKFIKYAENVEKENQNIFYGKATIEFADGCFYLKEADGKVWNIYAAKYSEILGNIYEHPHLIEKP